MASLSAIRTAIQKTIDAGVQSEVYCYDTVPDVENLPAVIVEPLSADYAAAMGRGMDVWEFHVFVLVSRRETQQGQEDLDAFVTGAGPDSVREALYNRPNLGLSDTESFVYAMRGYGGGFDSAKVPNIGAVLKVRVETDGTK